MTELGLLAERPPATPEICGAGPAMLRHVAIPVIEPGLLFDVAIEDGRFATLQPVGQVGADAEPVATLWPGYTECHAHVALPANFDDTVDAPAIIAMQYLFHGVTQVIDMFGFPIASAAWQREDAELRPDIVHCGYAITAMCGFDGRSAHGSEFPAPVFQLGCVQDIDMVLDANATRGGTFLKVMFTDGVEQPGEVHRFARLSVDLLAALARAAAERGVICVLDCNTRDEVLMAYALGFRDFAHAVRDVVLSEADWQALAGARFVSTLSGLRPMVMTCEQFIDEYGREGFAQTQDARNLTFVSGISQPFGVARNCQESRARAVETMRTNSRAALARGVMLPGTDAGNAGAFHGYSLLGELRLLDDGEASSRDALMSAATLTSRRFFDRLGNHPDVPPISVGAEATFNLFPGAGATPGALPELTVLRGQAVSRTALAHAIGTLRASETHGKATS